jgi:hypothetical protein
MVNLIDIRTTLLSQIARDNDLPCHVGAFMAWVMSDTQALRGYIEEASGFTGQMRRPEHVAALGYGAASALLTPAEDDLLTKEIAHLSGREFFAPGRPLRFEVDGIALLGVSLGVAAHAKDNGHQWLKDLLARSTNDVSGDPWQLGLVRAARLSTLRTITESSSAARASD